jgi:hypothetical protein
MYFPKILPVRSKAASPQSAHKRHTACVGEQAFPAFERDVTDWGVSVAREEEMNGYNRGVAPTGTDRVCPGGGLARIVRCPGMSSVRAPIRNYSYRWW